MRACLALAALACFATSATHAQPAREANGPPCLTANTAMTNATAHGAVVGRLDGAEAVALLDRINATGEPTSYHADTVVVVLRPDRAIVALFGACHTADIAMRLDAFAEVWRAVRGQGV